MVPNPAFQPPIDINGSLPPLKRSTTLPAPATLQLNAPSRSLLAPEDAIYQSSPPRKQSAAVNKLQKDLRMTNGTNGDIPRLPSRVRRHKDRNRSGSRRRKGTWKKLLWVKQSCKVTALSSILPLTLYQTQTIIPIRIRSLNICNETPASNLTISGH